MSICLEPLVAEAEVTQTEEANVEFIGTVEIDQPLLMTSDLTLDCVVNTGWPVEVDPNGTQVTGPMTIHFSTTVVIPEGTSVYLTGNVIITGSLKAPGLSPVLASASAAVTVAQYHGFRIESNDSVIDMARGENVDADIMIYNWGNGVETVALEILDMPEDVQVSLSVSQVSIYPDDYSTVRISVSARNDCDSGMHQVDIKAVSIASGGGCVDVYTLRVYVNKFSDNFQVPGVPVPAIILVVVLVALAVGSRRR
jgi:hypothetical protein